MAIGSPQRMYSSALEDFPLEQSVKLKGNGYLHNTPSSASNRKTWTFSCWVKRSHLDGNEQYIFTSGTGNSGWTEFIRFNGDDTLTFSLAKSGASNGRLATTQKFRDTSAWYHLVFVHDSTNSTSGDRIRMYVNGSRVTDLSTETMPSVNDDSFFINTAVKHSLGRLEYDGSGYFDGYLSEVNFIVGLALTPTSFGRFNSYGGWQAVDTQNLTFGTNGFSMKFNSSGNLGLTGSGTNTDTVANWSVVSIGAENQVLDTPTNNFATLNPLWQDSSITLQEGNLRSSRNANMNRPSLSTISLGTGKWYFEALDKFTGGNQIGVEWEGADVATYVHDSGTQAYTFASSGGTYGNGSSGFGNNGGSVTSGARIRMIAYDGATGKLWGGANGTWGSSGNPAAGSNQSMIVPAAYRDKMHFIVATENSTTSQGIIANFGQDSSFAGHKTAQGNDDGNDIGDFYYTPPTGFLALCSANLPEPAVIPSKNFNTVIYSGNNTDDRNITGVGFQPDFSWIKSRATTNDHLLFDSVRGAGKYLRSNSNDGETSNADTLQAFISDGLEIGADSRLNANNDPVVAMNWKASTAFSNDTSATSVGSIDSAGKVNTAAGFSIIQYVGEDEQDTTVAHGLSKAPEMIWIKASSEDGRHWRVFFGDNTDYIRLNEPTARTDDVNYWNDTSPTSTVFSIGDANDVNDSGCTFISYNFHSVEGYSKVGLYTGNNNVDGTYTYTGFRPAFVIYKRLTNGADWHMYDNKRDPINEVDITLFPNGNNAESAGDDLDFLSNGFKQRSTGAEANANGDSYVYMAFAKTPFKYANAR